MNGKFELGEILATFSITNRMAKDNDFCKFVIKSIENYAIGDWGDTCEETSKKNDRAAVSGENVFAIYN